MIKEIEIHDLDNVPLSWWKEKLSHIRHVHLEPGLNILWGKNGAGKSSLLTLLARMFHAEQGQYSTVTSNSLQELFSPIKKLAGMPHVQHDGQGVSYYNPGQKVGLVGGMAGFDEDFFSEGMASIFRMKSSSGEQVIVEVGKIVHKLDNSKDKQPTWKVKRGSVNSLYQRRYDAVEGFLKPSAELGQPTILLDEPDRSTDIPLQARLWRHIFPNLSKKYQLVIATHSPFAVGVKANYIEVTPGYLEACRKAIGEINA